MSAPAFIFRQTEPRPHRRLGVAVLVLLLVMGGAALGGWQYWRRSLPQMAGEAALSGLEQKVEIHRDGHGIPHIFAANRADALRALGYIHASERFFGMEMNRRAGQGRLAEVAGADMLPLDKLLRALDLYRLAEKSFSGFQPENQALFAAYAEGVNAWLAAHRDRLPLEFTLLGIRPEPWKPADSVVWGKLMALRLSVNLRDELRRAALASQFSQAMVERLYPAYSSGAPVTTQPRFAALWQSGKEESGRPQEPGALPPLKLMPVVKYGALDFDAKRIFSRMAEIWPWQTQGASNEWVVSGARSITGKPLLANDPHLGLETPVLWYLVRVVTPDGELKGGSVPGLPGVLLGQNDHLAWGFTTTNSDVQDVFIETVDPKDSARYLTPLGSEAFETREEIIKVKDGADVTLTLRKTRHGPVISDFDEEAKQALDGTDKVLALAFTALRDDDKTAEALLNINKARHGAELRRALEDYQAPPQNIVYAGRDGHIGFINPGLVPVRKAGDGRYPVDGAGGAYDWRGMVPFSHWPRLEDPPGGIIFNANNAVARPGLYWLGREWEQPYRAERLENLLKAKDKFALQDMAAMQADILSMPARNLLPLLIRLVEGDRHKTARLNDRNREFLDALRGWDYRMSADRPEPLIFAWWLLRLYDRLARAPFGAAAAKFDPSALVVEEILRNPRGWCDTVLEAETSDCGAQVRDALAQTRAELSARYGHDWRKWQWGKEHYVPLANKVLNHLPGFHFFFGLTHPGDGSFYTLDRGGNSGESGAEHPFVKLHGAGYRAVYDLENPARSRFMIATGEAGHPLSPYYANLLPLWRNGEGIMITGTPQELQRQGAARLVLTP